ncbi:acetyl-CoA carboxylase, carboxyltransferase subunit beta [Paenibacillus mucilaginosus]|uniref:Acetyl-coenzyme A carboxylase carboxyl transferase subunit beta n=3 Tax=Paenibacillus mucilaginosus TaxID=61624 RepID=H6N9Y6_9BACL|nr:acetyl-CoA carboxylase, carboxyltransferase subunit beta [Paenibacillus mucilaginosus]AEI39840.1 AccD [Paenibacillus mucilaginosus KNP414]AFC28514.1 AccD [Paenibacillus mucilaginosus 3016]AFH60681.2 acetyl-CoA carboxylase subunit beta [Paenibacillus mucilaginosus K02]MCG7217159.1 acetyl-CoA carboxylase, carboxyltransferase subunit beta [Paenibacillus mucilaginosus]WDM29119.1 acetyl-CoA carboxylase carboxyltransferase subunit beta [Paenibacillus mucilaginosus]
MQFKDLFQKKRKYATVPSTDRPAQSRVIDGAIDIPEERPRREIPEGLMNKCPKCGTIQYNKELDKNLKVCTSCDYHYKLNAVERIQMTMDEGMFVEYNADLASEDPLGFPDYGKKYAKAVESTGMQDAVITGEGTIGGYPVVVAVMSFDFMGGSLGSVVGEKVAIAVEKAIEKKCPMIIFSTSGGARMQESILSLMQMAKTSAALAKLSEQGGLYVSVITDPTFGGVSASFAMLGDYIIAEPGAAFGFTGRRVIEQTIKQKLPDNFQTSEFNLQHGQVDMVSHRKELRSTLSRLLGMHTIKEEIVHGK